MLLVDFPGSSAVVLLRGVIKYEYTLMSWLLQFPSNMNTHTFSRSQTLLISVFLILVLARPLGDVGYLWCLSLDTRYSHRGLSFSEICPEYDIMRVRCAGLRLWKTGFVPCRTFIYWWRVMIGVMVGFWCLLALPGLNWSSSTKAVLCGQCGKNAARDIIVQSDHITQITLLTCGNIKLQRPSALIQVNVLFFFPLFLLWLYLHPMLLWFCGSVDMFFACSPQTGWPESSWDPERCEEDKICSSVSCQYISVGQSSAYAAPAKEQFVYFPQCCAENRSALKLISWQICWFFEKPVLQKQASRLLHVCSEGDVFPLQCLFIANFFNRCTSNSNKVPFINIHPPAPPAFQHVVSLPLSAYSWASEDPAVDPVRGVYRYAAPDASPAPSCFHHTGAVSDALFSSLFFTPACLDTGVWSESAREDARTMQINEVRSGWTTFFFFFLP